VNAVARKNVYRRDETPKTSPEVLTGIIRSLAQLQESGNNFANEPRLANEGKKVGGGPSLVFIRDAVAGMTLGVFLWGVSPGRCGPAGV
jgi:hypothetical protein